MAPFLFLGYWNNTTLDLEFLGTATFILMKQSQFINGIHANTWTELNEIINV